MDLKQKSVDSAELLNGSVSTHPVRNIIWKRSVTRMLQETFDELCNLQPLTADKVETLQPISTKLNLALNYRAI